MRDSSPEKPEDPDVKLKPILGMPPTTYLPLFYGAALVIALFLLLILPGLVRPGIVLTVSSSPPNAAVSIDGVIRGSSGEPIRVAAGSRTVKVSKPGYTTAEQELVAGRRLVGSLFFPRRMRIDVTLAAESAAALLDAAAREYSGWALVGEASGQYQFPPTARALALDLAATGNAERYDEFTRFALPHLNSEAQLNDLLAGALIAAGNGGAPGPLAISEVIQSLSVIAGETPGLPQQLAGFLSGRPRESLPESDWATVAAGQQSARVSGSPVEPAATAGAVRTFDGIAFVQVPAVSGFVGGAPRAERGGNIPYAVDLPAFFISQTEVTVGAYARFLLDVPDWGPENRDQLVARGLADLDYLRDWTDGTPSATLPVRNVSAFAAEAFAEWFAGRIGPAGLTARMPSEAEWDALAALDAPAGGVFAARDRGGPSVVGESTRGALGLYGLAGNVWEWTSDSFAAYARYYGQASVTPEASVHRVVRGGGWATPAADFLLDDRGSMPPDWCSGAVGFRIVLTES